MRRKVFVSKVFDRKVVVITGGCAGIGRALAVRMAQAGARLAILDLDQAALDSLVQHLHSLTTPMPSACVATSPTPRRCSRHWRW